MKELFHPTYKNPFATAALAGAALFSSFGHGLGADIIVAQPDVISFESSTGTEKGWIEYENDSNVGGDAIISTHDYIGGWAWDSYGGYYRAMEVTTNHELYLYDQTYQRKIELDPINCEITIGGSLVLTEANSAGVLGGSFVLQSANSGGSAGALLLEGTYDPGSPNVPVEGAGNRLMWYPEKSAFRAGLATGDEWDEANIGNGSVAFSAAEASGASAFAAAGADAAGSTSFAFGPGSKTGSGAIDAVAFAGGDAQGQDSFAFGLWAQAMAIGTTAIGLESKAYGDYSTAFSGAEAHSFNAFNIGYNNIDFSSDQFSFHDDNSAFEVGIVPSGSTEPTNVITASQGGDVQIGSHTATSDAPLEVRADGTVILSQAQGDISMGIYAP